jgi:hypothetical protein
LGLVALEQDLVEVKGQPWALWLGLCEVCDLRSIGCQGTESSGPSRRRCRFHDPTGSCATYGSQNGERGHKQGKAKGRERAVKAVSLRLPALGNLEVREQILPPKTDGDKRKLQAS